MISLIKDLQLGLKQHYIWLMFGWFDVKLKYRRSFLGPFWLTISIGVMIVVMGVLYSHMFNQGMREYMPFVGTSLVIWFFMMMTINEGATVFINASAQLTDVYLPLSTYIFRFLWRNVVIFLHNFLMIVILILIFRLFHWQLILFPFMLLIAVVFFTFFIMILGMICARFRDVPQIVLAITQVLMFVTPVFWKKEFLTKYEWITFVNPVFHILEILRAPILNYPFPMQSFIMTLVMTAVLFVIASYFVYKYKFRVPYWVD